MGQLLHDCFPFYLLKLRKIITSNAYELIVCDHQIRAEMSKPFFQNCMLVNCVFFAIFPPMISNIRIFLVFATLTLSAPLLPAQTPTNPNNKNEDTSVPTRFWQASVGGGHYMVALDRISAISRHKYLLDGALIVNEVTVDALGQALVRFYFISPVTEAMSGSGTAGAANRIANRGKELLDNTANRAGTDIQNMVVKKYPETTHARCIEFRLESEQQLMDLYQSVRSAWESGRGRKYTAP